MTDFLLRVGLILILLANMANAEPNASMGINGTSGANGVMFGNRNLFRSPYSLGVNGGQGINSPDRAGGGGVNSNVGLGSSGGVNSTGGAGSGGINSFGSGASSYSPGGGNSIPYPTRQNSYYYEIYGR